MNTVKVRNIEIGSGVPKICVPIVGVTKDEIIAEAKTFDSIPVDVVEWRVDWFEGVFEFDKVEDVLKDLREALGETPILFTFRTSKEGGEKAIEAEPYKELNIAAAKTGYSVWLAFIIATVLGFLGSWPQILAAGTSVLDGGMFSLNSYF